MRYSLKTQRYSLYALMAASFVYLVSISWCRWGDLLIDTFRDQWIFYSLLQGKVLYRDLFYVYGFLPPYFVAFIYKLFGIHMMYSLCVGIGVTTITTFFIYRIGRLFLNRIFTTLLVLNFLFVFAFNASSFLGIMNFILPYSIASTFFIMFALASLYCFIKFIQKEKNFYFVGWVLLLYGAFLSRIDFSLVAWGIFCMIGIPFAWTRKEKRFVCFFSFPLLAAIVSYGVFLQTHNAVAGFNESALGLFRFMSTGTQYFNLHTSGFEHLFTNARRIAASFFVHIVALSFFYLLGSKISEIKNKNSKKVIIFISYGVVFGISVILARSLNYHQFALIPLILIIGIVIFLVRLFLHRESDAKRSLCLVTLFSISLILIMRILLKTRPHGHGFFLFCPALICYYIFCVELCPSVLFKKLLKNRTISRHYFIFLAIMLVVLSFPFIQRSHYWLGMRRKGVEVPGKMNAYYLSSFRTKRFCQAIDYVMKNTSEDATVVVFPSGIGLNFLAQRNNPLRYTQFHPTYMSLVGEETIIQGLEDNSVDYIMIVTRPTPEHGLAFFGRDYGNELLIWIKTHYELEALFGPDPLAYKGFGVAILKRK